MAGLVSIEKPGQILLGTRLYYAVDFQQKRVLKVRVDSAALRDPFGCLKSLVQHKEVLVVNEEILSSEEAPLIWGVFISEESRGVLEGLRLLQKNLIKKRGRVQLLEQLGYFLLVHLSLFYVQKIPPSFGIALQQVVNLALK